MKGHSRLELQKQLNVVTFVLALIECLCFSGIIFGWFSIRPVLEKEGFFGAQTDVRLPPDMSQNASQNSSLLQGEGELGENFESNSSSTNTSTKLGAVEPSRPGCVSEEKNAAAESDAKFNLLFTMASSAVNYSSLVTGFLLDKFGTLLSKLLATLLLSSGLFVTAFATPEHSWLLLLSFSFLLPVGGYWHFISNFQIGNLFGKWQGTVVTIFSGAFDSSSFVFLLFAELYGFGFSLRTIFTVYGVSSAFLLANTLFFLPKSYIPFPLPENWTRSYKQSKPNALKTGAETRVDDESKSKKSPSKESGDEVDADEENNLKEERKSKEKEGGEKEVDGQEEEEENLKFTFDETDAGIKGGAQRERSRSCSFLWDCVFTWKYFFHVVFVSVNQLKIYIFLSVVLSFLNTFDISADQFDLMRRTLGVIQLTGILWSPIVGLIIDRNKHSNNRASVVSYVSDPLGDFALPLFVTCILGSICSAVLLVPYASVQYASFVLQVVLRAFNYGLAFSFIACNFPPQHIGKLIGLLMAIAASFSLLQYPIIQSVDTCDPDYFYVHLLLLALGILPFGHPIVVWKQAQNLRHQNTPKLQDDYDLSPEPARTSSNV